ncbi:MAG: hypothetical protein IPH88_18635 [Bacteroidales bacterium]|nr:hypothetical protein [Bacteroidales bacterium]
MAQYMDDNSFNESFSFYGATLSGVAEQKPRWKRVVEQTDGSLGELVGQVYAYNPSNNEICVPGCNILVPGYEHVLADDAILYSIIGGSTFGHEITHGFDDQGCKYDREGNQQLVDGSRFSQFLCTHCLIVEQFNAFVAIDSLHINGE